MTKHQATSVTLPFIKKEQIVQNVYCFYFENTRLSFQFLAGQYVQMTLPHPNPDERGSSRSYTIASSPTEKEYLMITTREGKSSFKKALFDLKKGDSVQFFGPIGTFMLPED